MYDGEWKENRMDGEGVRILSYSSASIGQMDASTREATEMISRKATEFLSGQMAAITKESGSRASSMGKECYEWTKPRRSLQSGSMGRCSPTKEWNSNPLGHDFIIYSFVYKKFYYSYVVDSLEFEQIQQILKNIPLLPDLIKYRLPQRLNYNCHLQKSQNFGVFKQSHTVYYITTIGDGKI